MTVLLILKHSRLVIVLSCYTLGPCLMMYILIFLLMKATFSLREKGHSDTSSFFQKIVSVKHTMQDLICTHNKGLACIYIVERFITPV